MTSGRRPQYTGLLCSGRSDIPRIRPGTRGAGASPWRAFMVESALITDRHGHAPHWAELFSALRSTLLVGVNLQVLALTGAKFLSVIHQPLSVQRQANQIARCCWLTAALCYATGIRCESMRVG